MKKFLLMMAFAMSCSCAFAQFGQLSGSGTEKKSKKVDKQVLVEKEKSKKGIETTTTKTTEKESMVFLSVGYTAAFDAFDKGMYGFDFEVLNGKSVIGSTFGYHTNAGIMDHATHEVTPGLTLGTSVANNKLYVYIPAKVHIMFGSGTTCGISFAPSLAYKVTKGFGLRVGLPITKAFVDGSKVSVGLSLGIGVAL